jgi:ankyrin repeat protein
MPTLYDVAHIVAWNGYTEDMLPYLGVDKAAWTNDEFWFPHVVNFRHGPKKKTRIQRICENSYAPFRRVKQLLAYGADPDIKDEDGNSPLINCCNSGSLDIKSNGKYVYDSLARNCIETIEILINAGADVNQCKTGFTPMHFAAKGGQLDIMKILLANGADLSQCKTAPTPMHLAVKDGHIQVVKLLLANRVDINIRDSRDGYPIDIAAKEGNIEIVKLLMKGGAIISDETIYNAIDGNHDSILSYITKVYRAPADSIYKAVYHNSAKVVQTLAKMGGDLNFIIYGRTLVERAVLPQFKDNSILNELCKAGANMNITAVPNAMPPIFLALLPTYVSGVKILCKHGVDVNILYDVSHSGHHVSPIIHILQKKAHTDSEDKELYEMFMALLPLSDLTLADSEGKTPIEYAKKHRLPKYEIAIDHELRKRKKASA